MKSRLFRLGMMAVVVLWVGLGGEALAKSAPVTMITQVKGDVQYSKDGIKWKAVRRNKFLFAYYQIKTGGDGSGRLINQKTNMARDIGPDSVIKISKKGAKKVSGTLSDPQKASGSLMASLSKRFKQAQKYTAVRRGVKKNRSIKLLTVKKITMSSEFPELVWANLGSKYAYRLVLDGKSEMIRGSDGQMVRHKISGISPGKHKYRVELVKEGATVYSPKKAGEIIWLSDAEKTALHQGMKEIEAFAPGDDFMMANFLDDQGFVVAAMDLYRKYFKSNPDDVDMRPMLVKSYHDLKLSALKKAERNHYNQLLNADE